MAKTKPKPKKKGASAAPKKKPAAPTSLEGKIKARIVMYDKAKRENEARGAALYAQYQAGRIDQCKEVLAWLKK